jgi:LysR family transcriptional regulator, flagellar master operon regulator
MYLPRQKPGLIVDELLQEKLILVRHPELAGRWQDAFVLVHWGHEFRVEFAHAFPKAPTPTISVGLGALGLQYVLALKGAAYLPLSLAGPLLADHRLEQVEDAPIFQRPVYLVYPIQKRDAELLDLALSGLRKVASELTKPKRK